MVFAGGLGAGGLALRSGRDEFASLAADKPEGLRGFFVFTSPLKGDDETWMTTRLYSFLKKTSR